MVTPLPPQQDTREEIKTLDCRAVREGTFLFSTQLADHMVAQRGVKAMLASPACARKSRGLFRQRACSGPTKFSGLDPVPTSDPEKGPLLHFWKARWPSRGEGGTGRTGRAYTSRTSSLGPPRSPFPPPLLLEAVLTGSSAFCHGEGNTDRPSSGPLQRQPSVTPTAESPVLSVRWSLGVG